MLLEIFQDEAPILKLRAKNIDITDPNIGELIGDMKETMYHANGVGLAAPQIGQSIRLIVIDPEKDKKSFMAMINPKIISQQEPLVEGLEGCLSVSKWEGFVKRYKTIKVSYQTLAGEQRTVEFADFPARVIQHEVDHLNGILFTDKVKEGKLYTKEEVQKMLEENKL